ncbi:hypothetical protein KEJ15_02845 [Candidatus Bathyarchaeota archaeon]|nr:hypothetical protein [Candidatus Bathyarchaeota archaeon]
MQEARKAERADLYKDKNTQILINKFLSGELAELQPVYDPKIGYHYPIVEAIIGDSASADGFLDKLGQAGILKKKLYDKIIHCPKCGSANVSARYCCPYCKSFDIQKSSLIEHVKCGYMDIEEHFSKGAKLICPRCHDELKKPDLDYRRAGVWCTCRECNKSFDIPVTTHFCRNCEANSSFEDAIVKDVYAYSLNEEVKREAPSGWVVITPIRDFLQENGFAVESPAFLKGKSGANHVFDLAAFKGEDERKIAVIDLATSVEEIVTEQPVIALFAKIYDVSPDHAYLIAIPAINENGKKMAELYNIKVIEARNQKEAIKALKDKLLANSK